LLVKIAGSVGVVSDAAALIDAAGLLCSEKGRVEADCNQKELPRKAGPVHQGQTRVHSAEVSMVSKE